MDHMDIHTLTAACAADRSRVAKIIERTGDAGRSQRLTAGETFDGAKHHIS